MHKRGNGNCASCHGDTEVERDSGAERDERTMRFSTTKGRTREGMSSAPGSRGMLRGGALRMVSTEVGPAREDYATRGNETIPGRYVPIGFARYNSPVVDPTDYAFYRVAGMRIAIPRAAPAETVRNILYRVYFDGPASVGFVRIGDTMVPASLGPGDRQTLAGVVPYAN